MYEATKPALLKMLCAGLTDTQIAAIVEYAHEFAGEIVAIVTDERKKVWSSMKRPGDILEDE